MVNWQSKIRNHLSRRTRRSTGGCDVLLLDLWLARFYSNMLDQGPCSNELGTALFGMLPGREQTQLEGAFRQYAKTGEPMPQILMNAVAGIADPAEAESLRDEIRGMPRADFADIIELVAERDRLFDRAAFMKSVIAEYWMPPKACLPGEGDIDPQVAELMAPVERVRQLFDLSDDDVVLLMHFFCLRNDERYAGLCNFDGSPRSLGNAAGIIGLDLAALKASVSVEGSLRKNGLVVQAEGFGPNGLSIEESVSDFLGGMAGDPWRANVTDCGEAKYPLDSFGIAAGKTEAILSILTSGKPRHILIYGMPGAGKTEYCKSLVAASGRKGSLLKMGGAEEGRTQRLVALASVARSAKAEGAILVLDECDALLATEERTLFALSGASSGKEWLNGFLDDAGVTTIWITNDIGSIHESVKRRFHYSVRFEALPMKSRLAVWSRLAMDAGFPGLAGNAEVAALLRAFQPSPADMTCLLQVLEGTDESRHVGMIKLALQERRMLLKRTDDAPAIQSVVSTYDPNALRCSVPVADLERAVAGAVAGGRPLTILFHGEPGTGKTELAKYLANRAGSLLVVKRASDLLSKYVGDSEKRIAGMFREARRDGAILMLDEADSFLQDRRKSRYTWEVTQVNELLTQMEVFRGVFIACTNLAEAMDKAVMRRFSLKVKFEPLDEAGRILMFAKWFPGVELDDGERLRLCRIARLSPGDFRTVRALLWSLGRRDAAASEIVGHLASEAAYRAEAGEDRPLIGFSA